MGDDTNHSPESGRERQRSGTSEGRHAPRDDREARLARNLRANLKKRKRQQRARHTSGDGRGS